MASDFEVTVDNYGDGECDGGVLASGLVSTIVAIGELPSFCSSH